MATTAKEPQDLLEFARPATDVFLLPRGRIKPRTVQPRQKQEVENQQAIGESIKNLRTKGQGIGGTGVLQPLEVTWEPGAIADDDGKIKPTAKALINIGETRYWATAIAGFSDKDFVPVKFSNASDRQAYENGLIENLLRDDMQPEETAVALRAWMNSYDPPLGYGAAAKRLGKTKSWVQRHVAPLGMDEDLLALLDTDPKRLTILTRIQPVKDPEFRAELIEAVLNGATVEGIASRIAKWKAGQIEPKYDTAPPEPAAEPMRFGSAPPKGVPLMTRISIPQALDSAIRQMEAGIDALRAVQGRAGANEKRAIAQRINAIQELGAEFEAELKATRRSK